MCSNSYTKVDNVVLDDDKLPRSCKAVFVVLCRHANNSDRSCWLLVSTIVKESKYAERTVRGAIRKLVEAGLITRQDRYSEDGGQISSLYTIIGADAARYHEDQTPPLQSLHTPPAIVAPITKTPCNYKDSLTRENAPDDEPAKLSEVPEAMRSTAEYLLFKTGRENLTQSEISSLRELNASQYPARVQKEIDRACERFKRKKHDLRTLSFNYIAGALRNQPSRKLTGGKQAKPDMTQSEIQTQTLSESEMAEIEREFYAESKPESGRRCE